MKKFITLILLVLISVSIFAQDDSFYSSSDPETKESKKQSQLKKFEKWEFGGNFWLSFGYGTYIDLSPTAVYKATPKLKIGAGFTYIYDRFNNIYYDSIYTPLYQTISRNIYGPKIVIEYTLISKIKEWININIGNIILQCEYSFLETDMLYQHIDTYEITNRGRTWTNNFLIGGGIYQPFENKGGVYFVVLYDIIGDEFSPYNNPVFRFGFFF